MLLLCLNVSSVPGGQTGFGHRERQDALPLGGVVPFPRCSCIPAYQLTGGTGGWELVESWPARALAWESPTMLDHPLTAQRGPDLEVLLFHLELALVCQLLTDSQDYLASASSQLGKIIFHITTTLQVHHGILLHKADLLSFGPCNFPQRNGSGTNTERYTSGPRSREYLVPKVRTVFNSHFGAFSTRSAYKAVMGWHGQMHLKLEAGGSWSCSHPRQGDAEAQAECWAQPAASHNIWEGGLESWPQIPHVRQAHKCSLPPLLWRRMAGLKQAGAQWRQATGRRLPASWGVSLGPHHHSQRTGTAQLLQMKISTSVQFVDLFKHSLVPVFWSLGVLEKNKSKE